VRTFLGDNFQGRAFLDFDLANDAHRGEVIEAEALDMAQQFVVIGYDVDRRFQIGTDGHSYAGLQVALKPHREALKYYSIFQFLLHSLALLA
jgi:hypothetical protein